MAKFITKSFIVLLLFIFIVTFLSEQESHIVDQGNQDTSTIIINSADLYHESYEEVALENQISEQRSFTYQMAQMIEQSGLLIYDGIITVITDITKMI